MGTDITAERDHSLAEVEARVDSWVDARTDRRRLLLAVEVGPGPGAGAGAGLMLPLLVVLLVLVFRVLLLLMWWSIHCAACSLLWSVSWNVWVQLRQVAHCCSRCTVLKCWSRFGNVVNTVPHPGCTHPKRPTRPGFTIHVVRCELRAPTTEKHTPHERH